MTQFGISMNFIWIKQNLAFVFTKKTISNYFYWIFYFLDRAHNLNKRQGPMRKYF
jgi:hypothetical protein